MATFGQGTGAILLDQVACTGTETRLVDCSSNPLGVHDCTHSEDAGVTCQSMSLELYCPCSTAGTQANCTTRLLITFSFSTLPVDSSTLDQMCTTYIGCLIPLSFMQLCTLICHQVHQYVQMVTSGLLVEQAILKVVWRFATAMPGALCVMTSGEYQMPMWPVDNWASADLVSLKFDYSPPASWPRLVRGGGTYLRLGGQASGVAYARCRRKCIEARSADQSTQSAEKNFRLHFSVIRMGSRGTFVLCTARSRCMRIDAAPDQQLDSCTSQG